MMIGRVDLANSLFSYVNRSKPDSAEYVLADYFLRHYSELNKLNIYDVADECFVSRSSVRRFCQSLGFENFKDLKDVFHSYDDIRDMHLSDLMDIRKNQRVLLNVISDTLTIMQERMAQPDILDFMEMIHHCSSAISFNVGYSRHLSKQWQYEMLFFQKIIYVSSDPDFLRSWQDRASENDPVILVSNTGKWAMDALRELGPRPVKKILIIASDNPDIYQYFDLVLCLSRDKPFPDMRTSVKYAFLYFFDMLSCLYSASYHTAELHITKE